MHARTSFPFRGGPLVVCLASLIAAVAAAPACSSSPENPDGGGDEGGAGDAGPDTQPIPSPFGLDARPSNKTCVAPARPPLPAPVQLQRVFNALTLNQPMVLTQIPGDGSRFFVAQRGGTVVSFPSNNPMNAQKVTVLTIPQPVQTAGEGGFLGMAFHPKFAQNGHVFISYTTTSMSSAANMKSVVARMTSTDNGQTFGQYTELLSFDQPYSNHDGGGVRFGNDGYLYLTFGDGGSGGDPLNNGQNKNGFFGKLLRIDVDNVPMNQKYGIPPTNPFAMGGGEPATFAYGFRNPFRFSIDRGTGLAWVGDVGQNLWEEIDPTIKLGGNYGWRFREGTHCYNPANNCPTAGLIDPIHEYDHGQGSAVIGGVVYRGKALPDFVGTYLFADNGSGRVWTLAIDMNNKAVVTEIMNGGGGAWVDFGEDQDGEVYALSIAGGIYKLVAAGMAMPSTFPDKLSKTGCVASNPLVPADGLIPFAPVSPLWSDGAQKERFMAVPDGKQITIGADGDFDFPNGTVLVKNFSIGGKRVETRLLIRHDDGGWAGYSYEWDDAQTDATLLASSKAKQVGNQTWYYPSRSECMRCHTAAAGRSLGPETGQLNSDLVYPTTNRLANQMRTLEHIGMFDKPLSAPVEQLLAFPNPTGMTGTQQDRARAYLHANCSFCHRPMGNGGGNMDFRYTTPFGNAAACNADPQAGDLGIAGAKVIAPGDPGKSLVVQRMSRTNADRMPPLGTGVVDTQGLGVVQGWVQGLASCPGPVDAGTD